MQSLNPHDQVAEPAILKNNQLEDAAKLYALFAEKVIVIDHFKCPQAYKLFNERKDECIKIVIDMH